VGQKEGFPSNKDPVHGKKKFPREIKSSAQSCMLNMDWLWAKKSKGHGGGVLKSFETEISATEVTATFGSRTVGLAGVCGRIIAISVFVKAGDQGGPSMDIGRRAGKGEKGGKGKEMLWHKRDVKQLYKWPQKGGNQSQLH